jgi:protein SCO1/2
MLAVVVITFLVLPKPYTYQGSLIEPPVEAFQFELADAAGNQFRLEDHQGKIVLIFFGYANCPDVCPTTLADFKQVKEKLGEKAGQVSFVFITIDPERDTLENIDQYVNAFDPTFIGLSGSLEELQAVWDGYFVYREKVESDSKLGYLMDHTARVYLVDQEGLLGITFPFGISADAIYEDVNHILSQKQQ